jgi:hypothetical protein
LSQEAAMDETTRILNELAQGKRPVEEGVSWFSGLPQERQKSVLREVVRHSIQAHATTEDGRQSVILSGLKPTFTPAVLIVRDGILEQMGKIINLPSAEYVKAFRILISVFAIADTRRRDQECVGKCTHEWHHLD